MAHLILEAVIDPQPKPENTEVTTADPSGFFFSPPLGQPNALEVKTWDIRFPPVSNMVPVRNEFGLWIWRSEKIFKSRSLSNDQTTS